MQKHELSQLIEDFAENEEFYLAAEVDAKFKEYDDDNVALSQAVTKLDARIAELEDALKQREDQLRVVLDLQRIDH